MYTVNRRIRLCEQTSIPSDEPQGWVAGIVHHPVSGWWRGSASTQTFSYYQLSPQPFLAARRDTERIKWGNDFAPASLCIGCIQTTFVIGGASFAHEDVRCRCFGSVVRIPWIATSRRPAPRASGSSPERPGDPDRRSTEVQSPRWHSIWRPSRTYIRYLDSGRREYYGADDPGQLTNLYGDSVKGNEPLNQAARDARLERYARCAGSSCP